MAPAARPYRATGCRQLRGHLADHIRLSAAGGLPRKRAEGLTQTAAAKRLGIAQPHVSELKNYKLSRFSSERLLHYITLLNRDVEIFIRPRADAKADRPGTVMVWAAA